MRTEHFVWTAFVCAIAAIVYLAGDGFYRYPCQSPELFTDPQCNPPICLRTGMCATDLTGVSE